MTGFFDINASQRLGDRAKAVGWELAVEAVLIKTADVQNEARKHRAKADVILAGGSDKINRLASDCWEVDLIGSPELHEEKDFMHQMNSGIDYVIAKACAEKGIAIEFCFANVLNSSGRRRSQLLARMMQNVRICRDCKCAMVITSGAKDEFGLRAPLDLMAFGILLGMSPEQARDAVSKGPGALLKRSDDRRNPDILLKGLEVKKWASPKKEKKVYGWY